MVLKLAPEARLKTNIAEGYSRNIVNETSFMVLSWNLSRNYYEEDIPDEVLNAVRISQLAK